MAFYGPSKIIIENLHRCSPSLLSRVGDGYLHRRIGLSDEVASGSGDHGASSIEWCTIVSYVTDESFRHSNSWLDENT